MIQTSYEFEQAMMESFGDEAFVFGCDPEFSAYTGAIMNKPDANSMLRTAGGHVHVGYDNSDVDKNRDLIKMLDITLGLPSLPATLQI